MNNQFRAIVSLIFRQKKTIFGNLQEPSSVEIDNNEQFLSSSSTKFS